MAEVLEMAEHFDLEQENQMKEDKDSFDEILEDVEEYSKSTIDETYPIERLGMSDEGRLYVDMRNITDDTKPEDVEDYLREELQLTSYSLSQLFSRLGMPVRYEKKLLDEQPHLVARQFNFWRDKLAGRKALFRFQNRDHNDYYVRGVLSDRYTKLDNLDILKIFETVAKRLKLRDKMKVRGYLLNDKKFHARIVFEDYSADLGEGEEDILQVGVDIENSEVGYNSFKMTPLVYRQVCSNGLRMWVSGGEPFTQRHIHVDEDDLKEDLTRKLVAILDKSGELLDKLESARMKKIDNPYEVIREIAEREKLSKKLTDKTIEHFDEEPNNSVYGVVNSFTRMARDLNDDRRVEVEELAGRVLKQVA